MPVRKRLNKRVERADFPVLPELREAFCRYVDSEPQQPVSAWPEYWTLADLLEAAGAPVEPLVGVCCWHPAEAVQDPVSLAVYRRLAAT
ncbi:hypothetical protein [Mesorhizobium sp.]|uniref:hypothetical protein n=1 Tax=Mesorhizobium sp. TaxID=1871066 RepID=UPI0012044BB8|nr:hypothetical protein [Mesorhizobium sp.]TIQ42532.1 MAG: hypothetical protein E5X47_31775 [Mesorhizobium sp.]TIQ54843.1 MAG: hypothetical protein E5X46_25540 [Mesorhizobium sp.]